MPKAGKRNILLKQPIMRKMLLALVPCCAASVYFFGWRCLAVIVLAAIAGFVTEWIFARHRGEPVSEAVFVTSTIFCLILPPAVGFHIVIIGVVFAVMFSKEVFGGFGRNIFNPAMAGRCFVYLCFPFAMTANWAPVATGFWGALDRWSTVNNPDSVTGATPMAYLKSGQLVLSSNPQAADEIPPGIEEGRVVVIRKTALLKGLLTGRINGTMGVTSAIVILIGGVYLFVTKTASRSIILSLVISYAVLNQALYGLGVKPVPGAWPAVFGAGFLFAAFFMATDPVSAPRTETARVLYGILIGVCTIVIRNFSIFNGGIMFSILIGNMFAPLLDYGVRAMKNRRTG